MSIEVDVQYASRAADVPCEAEFASWVQAALCGERDSAELGVRIVDEEESRRLNLTWRGRARPTNVLAFPFEACGAVDLPLLGDLVICAPLVQREAREQGKPPRAHWAHLTVHGTLHLLGYDHEDEAQARRMESTEISVLARLGFPDPYVQPDAP